MDVNRTAEDLAAEMATQLRVRGDGLAEVAAKAGRKLPRHLQAEVQVVVEAKRTSEHPKLMHRVDEKRVTKAARRIRKFLSKQDPAAERRGEILDRLAAVAFVLFTVAVILFFFFWSRGAFDV